MKLVSAIITTHNRKGLLRRAIESVLSQSYTNIECIVVDDSSNDGTALVCEEYPIQYIYIPPSESRGGNYARNKGIKAAKGEYVAFLDDDDYWLPTKIEKQVKLIEEKGCELVHCGTRLEIIESERVLYQDVLPLRSRSGDMRKKILFTICTTTTNILVSRKALFDIGLFDEELGFWQEYELTIRLAQRAPFYFVNEPLSVYRVDKKDKQRLTNKYDGWKNAVSYIYQKHKVLYEELSLLNKFKVKLLYWRDSSTRAQAAGLEKIAQRHNSLYLMFSLPFRVYDKIESILLEQKYKKNKS